MRILLEHYKSGKLQDIDFQTLYGEMYQEMYFATESPTGALNDLELGEKIKAYQAFNSIFCALPLYREIPLEFFPNPNRCSKIPSLTKFKEDLHQ